MKPDNDLRRDNHVDNEIHERTIHELLRQVSERNRIFSLLKNENEKLAKQISEDNDILKSFEAKVAGLETVIKQAQKSVLDRDDQIAALNGELQEASNRAQAMEQTVAERDSQIFGLTGQLQEESSRTKTLELAVAGRDYQISALNGQVQEASNRTKTLELSIEERNNQVSTISNQLRQSITRAAALESEIAEMQRSVVWQITMRCHSCLVDRALPHGTRRRESYDVGLRGLRMLTNEGWRSVWFSYKKYRLEKNYKVGIDKKFDEILLENNGYNTETIGPNLNRYYHDNAEKKDQIMESIPSNAQKDNSLNAFMKYQLIYFLSQSRNELEFPNFETPLVSIIILTYNKVEYTFQCLENIKAHTKIPYELIIVDNGSTDETLSLIDRIKNVVAIKNMENHGFIKGCNQGAAVSRSKYILFLNNDIIVTPGSISTLVETIQSVPKAGAVGCKLVWPNGLLQEAGSIIWKDGSALGYGRGDNPMLPQYSYIKEVDYCSAACLLVRKDLFDKLGGFDERYMPAYYEDSDLCLGIQALGYRVIFQPSAIVFHHEFTSSSFDGARSLMESNRSRFIDKWRVILTSKMDPNPENILFARDVIQKESVLILDDQIPVPKRGSGFPRAYEMLKVISELGYKITFFPLDKTTPWQPYTSELQQKGIEVFYGEHLDFMQFAKDRCDNYDIIIVSRPHNMDKVFDIVKRYFFNAILIYDAEAIYCKRDILKSKLRGSRLDDNQIRDMLKNEINLMKKADLVITVSENEKRAIIELGVDEVEILGHSIPVMGNTEKSFDERKDILFVGGFLCPDSPNEDAVLYFAKEIFPRLLKDLNCRLFIVGVNPPNSIMNLSSSSIVVTGFVEDIKEYYENCRVFVVPHRFSAGIPWKLHEAMSYGIPSVVSDLTASQLDLEDGVEVLIAKDAEEFANKIKRLYKDQDLWISMQQNSFKKIRDTCDPEIMKTVLDRIIKKGLKTRLR